MKRWVLMVLRVVAFMLMCAVFVAALWTATGLVLWAMIR